MDLGEGNPEAWQRLGLGPLPEAWQRRLQSIDELVVGFAARESILHDAIGRIAGGACIHRSRGIFEQLPVSFLWEILTLAMVGKLLHRPVIILLPIAEESAREPSLRSAYHELGSRVRDVLRRLGMTIGVTMKAYWSPQLEHLDNVPAPELYGLFHPFSSSPRLRSYPLGEPDEDAQLRLNASYCARYRTLEGGLRRDDLIVEGIHIAQSVLLGVRGRASYLATVPLPDRTGRQLQADVAPAVSICQAAVQPSPDWWPNRLAIDILGLDLESLRRNFIA
jgi:hypothetical protein